MLRRRLLSALVAGCFGLPALANPLGPQVINGQVGFNSQGNVLSITNTPGSIINWQSFSINPGELTRFIQQNPNSAVLNRIVGQDPSQILGALQSNGRVFLINPNGILFGQGAQVDVNGLVASTLNISNEDFINGKLNFKAGDKSASLKNQGAITTPAGGQVYLIAPNVENSGIITSPKGDVLLAAGHSVQLVDSVNPDMHVVLSAPENEALNLGQIIAQGGKTGIYGALIKQRGIVNANSAVVGENGKIVFKASKDTLLEDGSRTTATGAGTGGEIQVLGERVGLTGDASIDASGQMGGGTVLVGGDYQGNNAAVLNAKQTYLGQQTVIKADAIEQGDGGKVIIWSDESTKTYGKVSARGGQLSGNGGFAETSGKKYLAYRGKTDLSAPNGATGTLLLDPASITIIGGTADSLDADALNSAFAGVGGNVSGEISATDTGPSVIYQSEIEGESLNNHITLDATDGISTSGTFTNSSVTLASGKNLVLKTRNSGGDGSTGIDLTGSANGLNLEFKTQGGGFISIHGGYGGTPNSVPVTIGKLSAGTGIISVTASGAVNVHNALTTSGGSVSITSGEATSGGNTTFVAAGTISTAGGSVGITAKGADKSISMPAGHQITTGGGVVNLQADNISLLGNINSGAGFVAIRPYTAAAAVELGGTVTDAAGILALDNDELKRITTSNYIKIGQATQTGNTGIMGDLDLTAGAGLTGKFVVNAGSGAITVSNNVAVPGQLSLTTTGNITQLLNKTIAATALKVSGADVILDEAANPVGVVAATATGNLKYRTANKLTTSTLSDIDGTVTGISLTGSPASYNMQLGSDSSFGINQSSGAIIDTNGGGLSIKTKGPVLLSESGNKIAKVAADLNLAGIGAGVFEMKTSEDLVVGGTIYGITGITTNNMGISISAGKSGFNKSITITEKIDSGTNTANSRVSLQADAITFGTGAGVDAVKGADVGIRPYTAGYKMTVGSATCAASPCLALSSLYKVNATTIGIGTEDSGNLPGDISVAGLSSGSTLASHINANTTRIGLLTGGAVAQTGTITVQDLGVVAAGTVNLGLSNSVTNLAAKVSGAGNSFSFVNAAGLNIQTLSGGTTPNNYNLSGVQTNNGAISLTAAGAIDIGAPVKAGTTGAVTLAATTASGGILQAGSGYIQGGSLTATAVNGIGNDTALTSHVGSITASNTGAGKHIYINNSSSPSSGTLTLQNISQTGAGSGIGISNVGHLIVAGAVTTADGSIHLKAASPLTVNTPASGASVHSTSGAITLEAAASGGSGDTLTINGKVAKTAVDTTVVVYSNGAITLKAGDSISIAGGIDSAATASVSKIENQNAALIAAQTPAAPPPPTVAECTVNPALSGCSAVLPSLDVCKSAPSTAGCSAVLPSLSTCTTTPSANGCSAVLPTLSTCTGAPTTTGCSVVLPTLSSCTATPTLDGCSVVLPALSACTATPTLDGCAAVLPTLSTCTTTPTLAGCTAVLPTLSTCTTTPTLAGCTAVLPALSACTATPALAGCTAVLPTVSTCTTTPTLAGCSVVLPTLSACTVTPALAGCSAVLPTVSVCTTTPTLAGCTAVLPTLSTCTSTPSLAGCTAVLPTLANCTTTPTLAGCTAVLPTVNVCTASPTLEGCSVVLPSLGACTTTPALAGCTAVLPTLSACSATPTLSGCTAVLPTLSQCSVNPTQDGCSVVVPAASKCVTNPSLPECQTVLPTTETTTTAKETITETVTNTVNTVVTTTVSTQASTTTTQPGGGASSGGTGSSGSTAEKTSDKSDDKKDDKKTTSGPEDSGAKKNEPAKKMYCN